MIESRVAGGQDWIDKGIQSVRIGRVMNRNPVKQTTRWFFCAFLFGFPAFVSSAATLDDLKKLEIICFVPSHLPQGFRLKAVEITYDEVGPDENKEPRFPLYSLEYGNGWSATFSIESAREGIGDRNIMEDEENAEETESKRRSVPCIRSTGQKEKRAARMRSRRIG